MKNNNNNKKIVIINGIRESGKDEFVKQCEKFINFDISNVSSVDKIKESLELLGVDCNVKDEPLRYLISEFKKLLINYDDIPFKIIKEKIDYFLNDIFDNDENDLEILFLHIREASEIEKIKNYHPETITLLIRNDNINNKASNDSDADVENYKYDYIIYNNGTVEDLKGEARKFLGYIYMLLDY